MTCPSCGHANDAGNRFCEYCGARLDPNVVQEPTAQHTGMPPAGADASYDAPTMFVPTEQGGPPVAQTNPPPLADASQGQAPNVGQSQTQDVICSVCGYANQSGDRFCDQCGASLQTAQTGASTPPSDDQTVVASAADGSNQTATRGWDQPTTNQAANDQALISPWSPTPSDADAPTPPQGVPLPGNPPGSQPSTNAQASSEALLQSMVMSSVSSDEQPTLPDENQMRATASAPAHPSSDQEAGATSPATTAQTAAPDATTSDPSAERSAIEAVIQEHRDNLAMFEQMATRYQGRAVPPHISTGLEESRAALAEAEARLQSFDEAQVAAQAATLPDPAELERLNNLIQEHRDNLAMFEQMATRYQGRAVPPHISTGLEESRAALAEAEAELTTLQRGSGQPSPAPAASPGAVSPPEATPPTQVTPPAEAELVATAPAAVDAAPIAATPMPTVSPSAAAESAVSIITPPVSPQPAPMPVLKPRLLIEASGATVELPVDKQTIVVGREDPISGIFPEVDLTPHGGEGGGVSRQHARILHDAGSWKVEDLNSTNYTKINGTKLAPNTPTDLQNGDKLHFGRVAMTFHS